MSEKLEDLEESQEICNAFWKIRALLMARSNNKGARELAKDWKISPRHARRHLRQADVYVKILLPLILRQPELELTGDNKEYFLFRVSKSVLTNYVKSILKETEKLVKADGRT